MKFLILAISYKNNGLCVAGIDLETKKYVRIGIGPTCEPIPVSTLKINGNLLKISDIIQIYVKKATIINCQTENYELIKIISKVGTASQYELKRICDSLPQSDIIFYGRENCFNEQYVKYSKGSLRFIYATNIRIHTYINMNGNERLKIDFYYLGHEYKDYYLTDSVCCAYPYEFGCSRVIGNFKSAYLMLSTNAEPFNNCFYKYVSGVFFNYK